MAIMGGSKIRTAFSTLVKNVPAVHKGLCNREVASARSTLYQTPSGDGAKQLMHLRPHEASSSFDLLGNQTVLARADRRIQSYSV